MKKLLLLILILFNALQFFAQNTSLSLNKNWQFSQHGKNKWYKAIVPGTIHTDLLANKLIPDPFYRDNENKLQWIDSLNWEYKTIFNVDEKIFVKPTIDLVFDGLDTYANVYLNGNLILQANNMFRGWTISVKPYLKKTKNELKIVFTSAQKMVDSIAKSNLPLILPDNNRVYARKAQFQFGWDWGPKFVGNGIWKDVKLEAWDDVKLDNLFIRKFNNKLGDSAIGIHFKQTSLINKFGSTLSLFNITKQKKYILGRYDIIKGQTDYNYPLYYLSKPQYNNYLKEIEIGDILEIKISGNNKIYAKKKVKYQINNTQLIQTPDTIGTSFYFEQNGKPVYVKGANWIPANIFLPSVKKEDYRKLLQKAKDANMNMLRVWGGGIYEADEFYNLCDEMGIMVWQDFMFAGGMYPADDAFMQNVKEEVKYQIERLRHHPCIVLWCGNNEIDEAWKNWGWQNQFNLHGTDSSKIWNNYKKLFADSLQAWVNKLDGTRPYISTSPKNGWGHKESLTEGDSHYWGVWWGLQDWEIFENKTGRFVSEYGMQAMPNWNTIKSYTNETDRHNFSPVINAHQKANEGFKKLNYYLHRYFIDTNKLSMLSLEGYAYLTQCLQYYILKNSIAMHRSKYPTNMGTLLWQLNDCWPVTSWSITDFSREPKAAWYAVKEGYRDDIHVVKDSIYPKNINLKKPTFTIKYLGKHSFSIKSDVDTKFVYLYKENTKTNAFELNANYFDLKANEEKVIGKISKYLNANEMPLIKIKSLYDVLH